jgi:hypothetical protein
MSAEAVFAGVVGARFLVPLFIIRFPLPAIVASLVLDGVDQTIFQSMGYDPPGYQGYDKAMDVYYLAIAYLATLRNWTSRGAFAIGRGLYFYRLVGVVAFELSQWRPLLLIFPNTFEYFFIAYEALRLRWDPARLSTRTWALVAAAIWVFVKLPQEWWIHIAQLDLTDEIAAHAWLLPTIVVGVLAVILAAWRLLPPRLGPPAWRLRVASDPLPEAVDEGREQMAWVAAHARVLSGATLEKILLVGLISVVYAQVLPDLRSTSLQLFVGVSVFVVVNAALVILVARTGRSVEATAAAFAIRLAVNVALALSAGWALGGAGGDTNVPAMLFFVLLLTLITTLHDRYLPVHEVRRSQQDLSTPRRSDIAWRDK